MLGEFVPVADEVHRLQRGKDAESRFFQGFAEEGHYGGRTEPTDTRQGIYAVTPGGKFLASINTRNGKAMAAMLESALGKWKELEPTERLGKAFEPDKNTRFERFFPTDGLVLRCVSRDLEVQKELGETDWRREAWNQDFAWFRKGEVSSMIPEAKVGATLAMPKPLAWRLAQCHLLDNVRGQTPAYKPAHIKTALLTFQVTKVEGKTLHMAITGRTKAERAGKWKGGLECELLGRAVYDGERFTRFELVALGTRWGETQYNARSGQAQSRLGMALVLDDKAPRVAPANHWIYGWR
ncbi:MAG: hypothetical protein P1V35_10190 [Planctomycetota bacterium]|nr:hypothetical protein [Planctomycetota bacterium]